MLSISLGRQAASFVPRLAPLSFGFLLSAAASSGVAVASHTGHCTAESCPIRSQQRSSSTSAMAAYGKSFVIEPKASHTASLIFLHGLGDTGQGWCESLRSVGGDHVRIVCPTAKVQPVSLNGGFPMPSWFDIFGLGIDAKQDDEGVKVAAQHLKSLIEEEEKRGISADRIVVGGFSQGGAVALYAGLSSEKPLAGIAAFSTWLPMHQKITGVATDVGRNIPILQCHGGSDQMVPLPVGQLTGAFLGGFAKKHAMKVYPGMAHSSSMEELQDLSAWLSQRIAKIAPL